MDGEITFSLAWDPRDSEGPRASPPPVDGFRGVLAFLEDALAEEANQDSEMLFAAKALALAQLGDEEELSVAVQNLLNLLENRTELLRLSLAQGRYCIGLVLGQLGEHAAAEQALSDVASFYEGDENQEIRRVAVSALRSRVRELFDLGETEEIGIAWASVRDRYGPELDPAVRGEVALAGRQAAGGLLDLGRAADALTISDEVIRLYRSDTDGAVRGIVAVTFWVRLEALRRRKRLVASLRAARELQHFIGTSPEPEVVEAMHRANPKGAGRVLRQAHDPL